MQVVDTKPTSITVKWQGLDQNQAAHVVGYVLEYKSENEDDDWQEYNGITKHRSRQNEYKVQVRGLEEATEYFFRLKVIGKNDKRGAPGPEVKAVTNCGRELLKRFLQPFMRSFLALMSLSQIFMRL
ncbi:unnamed protein product [Toxocara canis]|uniref:Fibronectin type-III domain-containing protein n=1 Tax=Toxocara canis TaxID=6265 RepID=A0A3P7HFT9_TOXCA|nr:unnamed protein product [Toxocara canis]